ncbi:AraC family transcriptional regulator [Bacillus atrophaeus]|uniref:helix-turn-helix domain-containing protein n=1 Tax=Bacillus atrophaeus TaxID=1452 RepID=UPI0028F7054F|nr:AraC family transcriptional regulator [Bacillus atrophaeus]WNV79365.1 AraC family transcriptional regulator [Bacillus atrophaeus]
MYEIKLHSNRLPMIREIGHMTDIEGVYRHPDRNMDKVNVFFYVKQGAIHVFEDENEYRIQAGEYLFLKKNTPHWGADFYKPGTEWYYIHFYDDHPLDQAEEIQEFPHFNNSTVILDSVYSTQLTFPKSGSLSPKDYAERQLANILKAFESSYVFRTLQVCSLTYQFFIDLYSNSISERERSLSSRIITQIIELLHQDKNKKLASKDIENALGMNYAYLSTLFRKQTGKSITAYKNELLIEQAIDIFKKSNKNITEVSNKLGFSNPYYFSRVFKRVTGVSPSVYLSQIYRN